MEALKESRTSQTQFFDEEVQEVQEDLKRKENESKLLEPAVKKLKTVAGDAFGSKSVETCFVKPLEFAKEGK